MSGVSTRGVDANNRAVFVHQRAAGVAGADSSINLQIICLSVLIQLLGHFPFGDGHILHLGRRISTRVIRYRRKAKGIDQIHDAHFFRAAQRKLFSERGWRLQAEDCQIDPIFKNLQHVGFDRRIGIKIVKHDKHLIRITEHVALIVRNGYDMRIRDDVFNGLSLFANKEATSLLNITSGSILKRKRDAYYTVSRVFDCVGVGRGARERKRKSERKN